MTIIYDKDSLMVIKGPAWQWDRRLPLDFFFI